MKVPKTEAAWRAWLAERGISERQSVVLVDGVTMRKLAERTVRGTETVTIVALGVEDAGA